MFYPRAAGCPVCATQRRAEQLADKLTADRLVAVTDRLHREHALSSKLAQLEADTQRVIEQAKAEVARINAVLTADELETKRRHEQRARDAIGEYFFKVMTGGLRVVR